MHRPAPHRSPVARLVIQAALVLVAAGAWTPARAIDYRRFPWPTIVAAAVLVAVVGSGLVGNRWRHAAGLGLAPPGRPVYADDDGPVAEMEDLPLGGGLR